MSRRPGGFTLVELLVVVGIISILAAILFPTFAQVKERGRMTSCISNLRQISTAFSMYTSDYQSMPPFLASLYGSYLRSGQVLICKADKFKGRAPFTAPDWETDKGFLAIWGRKDMGCSYAYMPRAEFWYRTPTGARGLWGDVLGDLYAHGEPWAGRNDALVNTARWYPRFDHFTPVVFDWWHAQYKDIPDEEFQSSYHKKASVLVLVMGGSVLRCDHERLLPCRVQIGTAASPREVLH